MKEVKFSSLIDNMDVLQAVTEMGYETPTEIQEKAIPLLKTTTKDFIGQAKTGTGKTAAFSLPLLDKIDQDSSFVQVLILAPTRELATQVESEIKKFTKYTDITSTCIYGGSSYEKQFKALRAGPQIVVGTPGRVWDLIKKNKLILDHAKYCVLDEADEMLNMGFLEDVKTILDVFDVSRQLIMFSATMSKSILNLIGHSFNEYDLVKTKNQNTHNAQIDQKYFIVKNKYKTEALARLIDLEENIYAIVFCKTKIETKEVGDDLKKRGYRVEVLNGDMGQNERDYSMRKFKEKKATLMVCTDVAARGIDVNHLTHVFNYGLPQNNESYVHRIGRTGRAGSEGKAYTIVGPKSAFAIKRIERDTSQKIELGRLPRIEELKGKIVDKEIANMARLKEVLQEKGETFKIDKAFENFSASFSDLSSEDLLKLMFSWKFNEVLRTYNNLGDIEAKADNSGGGGGRRERRFNSRRGGNGGGRGGDRRRGGRGGRDRDRGNSRSNDRYSRSDRDGNRSERSYGNRSERNGNRSERSYGNRSERNGNRSERSFGNRSNRNSRKRA